jgi:hypothetical protein
MKSTSLKQTEANRRNAARSCGPRTLEGKAASRFNALKSGVNASAEFIPGEDSLEYDDVRIAYDLRWNPQTPEQRCLIDRLIRCDWLQRRLGKAEAHLWRYRQGSYHPDDAGQALTALGAACAKGGADFERLQRRINQTQRTFDKTLETLQAMSIAAAEAADRGESRAEPDPVSSPIPTPPPPAQPLQPTPEEQADFSMFFAQNQPTSPPEEAAEVGPALSPATEPPETANPHENQQDAHENGFVLSNSPETPPSASGPIPKAPPVEYSTTIRVPRSFLR